MLNKGLMGGSFVRQPSITNPTASEIDDTLTPTLTSSAFVSIGSLTHASTDWQVASESGFSTIVWESLNDTTNKTSITTSALGGGERYVRCRYKSNTGLVSSWSSIVQWTSPWVAGSNMTITSSANADVNATTTLTFQAGTYRITLWGAAGGKGAGSSGWGGAGGSTRKSYTFPTSVAVPITIGTGGGEGCHCDPTNPPSCTGPAAAGTPGGGAGGYFTHPNGTWNGGGGGGMSLFSYPTFSIPPIGNPTVTMYAAGGGGGATSGNASAGDQPSSDNPAGWGGAGCGDGGGGGGSGAPDSNGGGGGSHVSGGADFDCEGGNGGQNAGNYDDDWSGSNQLVANPYSSPAYSRVFGFGNGSSGGARIEKM